MPAALALVVLLAPLPAVAGGYGQYAWGETLKSIRGKAPKLRRAEPDRVEFEARALRQIRAEEARAAKAAGRDAWRAFREKKRAKPRLGAWWYWVDLLGLSGRVELHFVDRRLYAAVVRVLYAAGDQAKADRLLALVTEKYGAPQPPPPGTDPTAWRPKLVFDAGDGQLTLYRQRPTASEKGLLRFVYRGGVLAGEVERYLQGLEARLTQAQQAREAREAARAREKEAARKSRIFKHL